MMPGSISSIASTVLSSVEGRPSRILSSPREFSLPAGDARPILVGSDSGGRLLADVPGYLFLGCRHGALSSFYREGRCKKLEANSPPEVATNDGRCY